MEQVIRIAAACVLAALLSLVLQKRAPEAAMLVCMAASVAAGAYLTRELRQVLALLTELAELAQVSRQLLQPLYKTVGIALVVRLGSGLCRDAGQSALAAGVETAGAVCALLAALPLVRAVMTCLMELME